MVMLYSVADGKGRLARDLWIECFPNRAIPYTRTFTSALEHPREPQTQDRDRDRTERILQVEEQILKRVEEEPNISTRRLAATVGSFTVYSASYIKRTRLTFHTTFKKCKLWSPLIFHVVQFPWHPLLPDLNPCDFCLWESDEIVSLCKSTVSRNNRKPSTTNGNSNHYSSWNSRIRANIL